MDAKSIIKFYIDNTKGYRWLCLLLIFNSFLMSFETLIFGKAKSWIINVISKHQQFVMSDFTFYIIILGIGLIFVEILHCNKQVFERFCFPYINKNIIVSMYQKIQHMPYAFFQNNAIGTIISKIRCIKKNYESLFFDITDVFVLNTFSIVINIIALITIHKMLGITMIIYCILFIMVTMPFLYRMNRCVVTENNLFHDIMGNIADKLTNICTIFTSCSFNKEKEILSNNFNDQYIPVQIKTYRQIICFLVFGGAFYVLAMIVMVYYTIFLKINNIINIGDVVLIITLIVSISNSIWAVMEKFSDIVEEFGELQSAFSIFEVKEAYLLPAESKNITLDTTITPSIDFKHVTFSYPNNDETVTVFDDFNLSIKPGEKIGIIGESGVGKTSLFSLLLKYFKCNSGDILINGVNINDISTESLMNDISVIPQHITLFQRSIIDNLRYGCDDFPEEQVHELCKKVNLHESIMNMPDGYGTIIGEGGGKISGGQKQRIAIVRAFIKRAKIILLDEATSALDIMTEKAITDTLEILYQEIKPTVITISHKLYTVKNMDRIIILDDGKIIEEGSHNTLLANNESFYSKLWHMEFN